MKKFYRLGLSLLPLGVLPIVLTSISCGESQTPSEVSTPSDDTVEHITLTYQDTLDSTNGYALTRAEQEKLYADLSKRGESFTDYNGVKTTYTTWLDKLLAFPAFNQASLSLRSIDGATLKGIDYDTSLSSAELVLTFVDSSKNELTLKFVISKPVSVTDATGAISTQTTAVIETLVFTELVGFANQTAFETALGNWSTYSNEEDVTGVIFAKLIASSQATYDAKYQAYLASKVPSITQAQVSAALPATSLETFVRAWRTAKAGTDQNAKWDSEDNLKAEIKKLLTAAGITTRVERIWLTSDTTIEIYFDGIRSAFNIDTSSIT